MLKERSIDRVIFSTPPSQVVTKESLAELLRTLATLLENFEGPEVDPGAQIVSSSPVSECWRDESYCYIEADLSGWPSTEIDVNVSNGRAFIRMGL
jgi:HSP20 family molecular chaperone IbpA